MNEDLPQFEDPALKAALKRAVGAERAPEALRQRVAQMMGQTPVTSQRTFWARRAVMALAATVLIVLGGLYAWQGREKPSVIAQPVVAALMTRHDGCCQAASHWNPAWKNMQRVQIGQAIGTQLRTTVLMADLGREGWKFKGPEICPVGEQKAAHLIYTRGDEQVSVFSLPAVPSSEIAEGGIYTTEQNGHALAGFVKGGVVYCMVGTSGKGELDATALRKLLKEHRGEMVSAGSVALAIDRPGELLAARE